MENQLVLVYGTLRKGEGNYERLLTESKQVLDKVIVTGFQMFDLGYFPACVCTGKPEDKVTAELFEVDFETFQRLDRLEGYPNFYNRVKVDIGSPRRAWIYTLANTSKYQNLRAIPHGDWLKHKQDKANANI